MTILSGMEDNEMENGDAVVVTKESCRKDKILIGIFVGVERTARLGGV